MNARIHNMPVLVIIVLILAGAICSALNQPGNQPGGPVQERVGMVEASIHSPDEGPPQQIARVQDTVTYKSKDTSLSGSVTFGIGFSGNASASLTKVNADYASVKEQAGIKAGDGGFAVNVKGNTDLKGAVIASTDQAAADGKNSLTTAHWPISFEYSVIERKSVRFVAISAIA